MMQAAKKTKAEKGYGKMTIDPNIKSHANDPFVLKKIEEARETLNKLKLPEYLK